MSGMAEPNVVFHAKPRIVRSGAFVVSVLLVLGAVLAGCAGSAAPAASYESLLPTREAAAQAVVDALSARDVARLTSLAITEAEFRTNVWPALPASDPAVGMPAAYLWSDTNVKSRGDLAETLQTHGGQPLEVLAVRFAGRSTDYDGFRVHSDTRVTVRDAAGQRRELRLFGSMLETPSGWKVYSYVVD